MVVWTVGENPTSAGNQQESLSSEEQCRWFLAGVIEGEGSVYVGIKSHPTVPLGFFVQPGFSITQHRHRRSLLELAREEFGAGTIYPKPGNESVLVYSIHSRPVLSTVIAPFLGRYMRFSARRDDFGRFRDILGLFAMGAHRQAAGHAQIVDIAYAMNLNGNSASVRCRTSSTESSEAIRQTPWPRAMRWSDLHGDVESWAEPKRPSHSARAEE